MIRTANLTHSLSRNAGGLFESVRRLVQGLSETGMQVQVFGVKDRFTEVDIKAWQPVPVLAFEPIGPQKFGYSPKFLKELRMYEPHITHTHGIWAYSSVATNAYCRQTHSPYVISAHGMLDPWAIANSRWKKVLAHFLYESTHLRGARCLRALCESEARSIRRLGLKNDIAIIPNGIDLPTAPPVCPPPWQGLLEPGQKILLFLSRIHPKKGLPCLIRAWAAVQEDPSARKGAEGWILAIAGWDQDGHEAELKKLATELGLTWVDVRSGNAANGTVHVMANRRSVLFLGPQFNEAKASCYYHCDSFVLPSLSEGVPMVVLEAWGRSKQVLMTPFCNLPEAFPKGAAIEIGTCVESVAAGLKTMLLMTANERTEMGRRGYALAAERYTWPRVTSRLSEVYNWILGGGSTPACIADF